MTRFARAHGSKSSNERLPEEATSWNVMKRQLQDKLQSSGSVADADNTTQKIWKSSDFEPDSWNKNNTVWVEFEENSGNVMKNSQQIGQKTKKGGKKKNVPSEALANSLDVQKKFKKQKHADLNAPEFDKRDLSDNEGNCSNIINTVQEKKKKLKKNANTEDFDNTMKEEQADVGVYNMSSRFNRAKKQKFKNKLGRHNLVEKEDTLENTGESITEERVGKKRKRDHSISEIVSDQSVTKLQSKNDENQNNFESSDNTQFEKSFVKLKNFDKKKRKSVRNENILKEATDNSQTRHDVQEEVSEIQDVIDSNAQNLKKKKKKHKQKPLENILQGVEKPNTKIEKTSQDVKAAKIKNSHIKMEKQIKRPKWQNQNDKIIKKRNFVGADNIRKKHGKWKKNEHVTVLHMNGREIEIVKFDGFPIKREDAENLKILKQKLITNGVPPDEVKATMKLERRKAEKALAREKKKVCFHCRKSGHVLSECPELGKAEMEDASGTGICFKCGSSEHKHFECRVTREQEFRFAKCFVCDEQGHIARQCPDNPRGLYPKGGGCHVCGDVTHLKKDCPDLIKEKEQKTIRLPTLSSKSLEVLEDDDKNTVHEPSKNTKKKKMVKF